LPCDAARYIFPWQEHLETLTHRPPPTANCGSKSKPQKLNASVRNENATAYDQTGKHAFTARLHHGSKSHAAKSFRSHPRPATPTHRHAQSAIAPDARKTASARAPRPAVFAVHTPPSDQRTMESVLILRPEGRSLALRYPPHTAATLPVLIDRPIHCLQFTRLLLAPPAHKIVARSRSISPPVTTRQRISRPPLSTHATFANRHSTPPFRSIPHRSATVLPFTPAPARAPLIPPHLHTLNGQRLPTNAHRQQPPQKILEPNSFRRRRMQFLR